MGPHPEVPVDVQKYIGSYLITQQPRPKRKSCPRHCEKNAGYCGGGGASPPVSVCNCRLQGIDVGGYPNLKNYAWTGLPLISIASARQKNRVPSKHRISPRGGKPQERERIDYIQRTEVPECSTGSMSNLEDILPISRLAIHAQGAPLIISSGERDNVDVKCFEFRSEIDGCMSESRDLFWGSGSSSPSTSVMMSSPSSYCLDDGDPSDISSRQMSPLPSDSVSTTSEDSGTSENGLPRIIKPRKRRKKDRRMTVGFQDPVPDRKDSVDEVTSGRAIVTLKPYQPLCYGYSEPGGTFRSYGQSSPPSKEYYCDSSRTMESRHPRTSPRNNNRYPYPSSPLCRCPYCVPPPATLITPPDSPVDIQESNWKNKVVSSSYEVSAEIVTTPGGGRDLEIKFLPSSSDEDANVSEDLVSKSGQTLVLTPSHPPQRPWVQLAEHDPSMSSCTFTVMCYNILCDKYATRQMYGYCPNWALDWNYRKKSIMQEIRHYKADIISLQEVETEQFYHFFLPELKKDGYDGIFSPKSRAKTMSENERKHVDGCAIFFKTNKFFLLKEHLVEFNQLAMANAEGSDDMLNRVMTKDNIGLAALLQTRAGAYSGGVDLSQSNQTLLVCTAHIHWDPEYSDVKLIQTMMLMHELQSIVMDTLEKCNNPNVQKGDPNCIPLLLCGDFNSLPDSGVIEFLSSGRISTKHCDFKQFFYEDCLRKLGTSLKSDEFTHPFRISRAYRDDIMPFTNYSYDFKGIIDYVFYSLLHMTVLGVLGPVDSKWLQENRVQGCPHPHVPSDHFPILVEVQLAPSSPIHPPPPNGVTSHR